MRDKTYKTGHGKMFYRLKRAGIFCSIFLSSCLVISVPIIISISNSPKETVANPVISSSFEDTFDDEETILTTLVYPLNSSLVAN